MANDALANDKRDGFGLGAGWYRLLNGVQRANLLHGKVFRTGLINSYPTRQAASIVALAAFNVAWVSRAILPFAIKLRSLAFRVVVE